MIEKYIQLDKRRNQTISKQLELSLYSIIMSKTFPDDYSFPPVQELADTLQINVKDVQTAYNALIKSNVLEFVDSYKIKKNILPTAQNYVLRAIVESIKAIGLEPNIVHIDQINLTSSSLKKSIKEFDDDDTLVLVKRIYTGNDHPIVYLDEYLSTKYLPDVSTLDLTDFKFYPYVFEVKKDTYTVKREMRIDSMPKHIAHALSHSEGIPSIHTTSKCFNSEGHLIEASEIWAVADYFKFTVDVDL